MLEIVNKKQHQHMFFGITFLLRRGEKFILCIIVDHSLGENLMMCIRDRDEFYDIAEKLTKEDGSQYGFAANPSNEQDTWMNIVYSMGGRVLTDDASLFSS